MKNTKLLTLFQQGILLFWALWSSLVFSSDLVNLMQHLQWAPAAWHFTSHNYALVAQTLSQYDQFNHPTLTFIIFLFILAWSAITALLFWLSFLPTLNKFRYTCWAFFLSLGLDALFVLSDEFFIQYKFEEGHMARLGFKLLTFLTYLFFIHFIKGQCHATQEVITRRNSKETIQQHHINNS